MQVNLGPLLYNTLNTLNNPHFWLDFVSGGRGFAQKQTAVGQA